jgi:hypothetical protein
MIRIYYHIYAIDGVESIIEEQLSLMETHFNFKHIINIGICLSEENIPIDNIIKLIDKYNKSNHIVVCDIKNECNEFVTLDLIETHKSTFDDNDLIFYLHTKGASKQKSDDYKENVIWRNRMQDVNIKNHNHVFNLFNSTDFNTYGLLLENVNNLIYSGNFWWVKGKYIKTINIEDVEKNRWNAESQYIQNGTNWNPYSEYVKMIKTKPPYYKKNKLI